MSEESYTQEWKTADEDWLRQLCIGTREDLTKWREQYGIMHRGWGEELDEILERLAPWDINLVATPDPAPTRCPVCDELNCGRWSADGTHHDRVPYTPDNQEEAR